MIAAEQGSGATRSCQRGNDNAGLGVNLKGNERNDEEKPLGGDFGKHIPVVCF